MKAFVEMCAKIGAMKDYVQGGGGNASCKHDGNKMAIKASGFTIGEITETAGYADVDFGKIRAYHTDVPANELEVRENSASVSRNRLSRTDEKICYAHSSGVRKRNNLCSRRERTGSKNSWRHGFYLDSVYQSGFFSDPGN